MDPMLSTEELRDIRRLRKQFEDFLRHKDPKERKTRRTEARKFLAKRSCWVVKENPYLKSVSADKELLLAETDGTELIFNAKDVFTAGIDSDFKNWGCNTPSSATKETKTQVYEMVKEGTLAQLFGGFGENVDRLCFTQSQIIQFVKKHSAELNQDRWNFFLFKVGAEYFVARVYRYCDGWNVYVNRLSNDDVLNAGHRYRIVVPQL